MAVTIRREHLLAAGVLAVAAVGFYAAHNYSGGSRPPKYSHKGVTESLWANSDPVEPIQPDVQAGYLVTQHRYPYRVGHEITAMIQGGHSVASVPRWLPEAYLIVKPPSELVL